MHLGREGGSILYFEMYWTRRDGNRVGLFLRGAGVQRSCPGGALLPMTSEEKVPLLQDLHHRSSQWPGQQQVKVSHP